MPDITLDATEGVVILDEVSAPATPASGKMKLYGKSDGLPYVKNDAGAEYPLSSYTVVSLYDSVTPNDSGGFSFDVGSGEALNCDHLELICNLRSSPAATSDIVYIFFNTDLTAANYRYSYHVVDQTPTHTVASGATPTLGFIAAGNSPTGAFDTMRIFIPNFRSTTFIKRLDCLFTYETASGALGLGHSVVKWTGVTSAITTVKVRPDGYATDTFNSSSLVAVRGWKL